MDLDPSIPKVRADAEQLRQVLINLIRNAFQAMGVGGAVYVSTRARVERHLAGGSDSTWVEVAVRDEGPGIAPSVMKNLFVPFVTTKERGTGLGLAISQRVVAEMGGRIDAVSSPGMGSTFTVLLPAATDAVKEGPTEGAEPSDAAGAASPAERTASSGSAA
jgi:signal transduction histidine kinase